jgi:2-methylisocitrate lyase-like PEP mutase family enzyme
LGFEALATTSAGYSFSVGQQDSSVGREAMMAHLAAIAEATDLPVGGDSGILGNMARDSEWGKNCWSL